MIDKKRRFIIKAKVYRSNDIKFEAGSKAVIDEMFGAISKELEAGKQRVNRRIQNGPGFNKTLRTFSRNVFKKVKNRFIENPPSWGSLSSLSRRVRHFRLNPKDFEKNIQQYWKGDNKPNFRLDPGRIGPKMRETGPILYQSGDLSRSISMELKVNDRPNNKRFKTSLFSKFSRILSFKVKSAYAPIQFNGGEVVLYNLEKTFKSGKTAIIPVPKSFVPEMRSNISLLKSQGFELVKKLVEVPARNPLFFDDEDENLLGEFMDRLMINFQTKLGDSFMNESNSSFDDYVPDKDEEYIF